MTARLLAPLLVIALLAGCTSSSGSPGGSSQPGTPSGTPSNQPRPGKVREVPAHSCRFASAASVRNTMGMRLGRVTQLKGRGVSGCRFYALQDSSLNASEHLPGPKQPVLEIRVRHYASAGAAHDVVVLTARSAHNPQRVSLGKIKGACFQTDFYPKDHGKDWACAANTKRIVVVVHSVDTTGTFSTATILRAVLKRV